MTSQQQQSVVIAVLTYKRLNDLQAVCPLLADQIHQVDFPVTVLIVDNDPEASAREYVSTRDNTVFRYVHEATPGISAARNRALSEAHSDDVLIFLDDDERPSSGWLAQLYSLFRRENCAAVVGPVVSRYEIDPDPWLIAGGFFERRRLATGTRVEMAASNNVLLDMSVIRSLSLSFNAEYGLSGGSDSLFTRQLFLAGHEIVWCDEAVVYDIVPASRLTREWVLKRSYRFGNSWSRVHVETAHGVLGRNKIRAIIVARAFPRIVFGWLRNLYGSVVSSDRHRARGLRTLERGKGLLAGLFGKIYSEYSRDSQ